MRITFDKLRMLNFKGIVGERTIEFNEFLTQIMGRNKSGKTTIMDAALWCLFGKDSQGHSTDAFDIKPNDENGHFIPHLDHSVELTLTADGKKHVIERALVEKWRKPRGAEEAVYDGNEGHYYIDGNKETQKDFQSFVDSLINEQTFRAVTNPEYFPGLKADEQRAILVSLVGETSIEEIAERDEKFKELLKDMAGDDLAKFKEHIHYKITDVKKELETIPARINEQTNDLEAIKAHGTDFEAIKAEITELEKQIVECDQKLEDKTTMADPTVERRMAIQQRLGQINIDEEKVKAATLLDYNKARQQKADAIHQVEEKISEVLSNKRKAQSDRNTAEYQLQGAQNQKSQLELRKEDFRIRWSKVTSEVFAWDDSKETCPTCGQTLPYDVIAEMKNSAEANFNTRHANEMTELNLQAQTIKQQDANIEASISSAKAAIETANAMIAQAEQEDARLKSEMEKACAQDIGTAPDYRLTDDYTALNNEREALKRENDKLIIESREVQTKCSEANAKIENNNQAVKLRKQELNKERDQKRDLLTNKQRIEEKEKRIAQLQEQEQKLNQQLADLEKKDATANELIQEQTKDLEEKVNGLFTKVRFKMFKTLVNGDVKPTCECMIGGVPYNRGLNNADKINAGLDIINAISLHNNVYAPVMIDNAESINDIIEMNTQMITLTVTDDKELVVIK